MPPFFVPTLPPTLAPVLDKAAVAHWVTAHLADRGDVFYLVDIELLSGRSKALHLLVDTDSGITLGECTELNRELRPLLEAAGLLPDDFAFEVSSPGVGRPLRLPRQFTKNVGRTLEVETTQGEKLTGTLEAASPEQLTLVVPVKSPGSKKPVPTPRNLPIADLKTAVVTISFAKTD